VLTLGAGTEDAATPVLQAHRNFLPEFFIVSQVTLEPKTGADVSIASRHATDAGLVRCPRCWRWVPALSVTSHGEVCPRCADALNS